MTAPLTLYLANTLRSTLKYSMVTILIGSIASCSKVIGTKKAAELQITERLNEELEKNRKYDSTFTFDPENFEKSINMSVLNNAEYLSAVAFEQESIAAIGIMNSITKPQILGDALLGFFIDGADGIEVNEGISAEISVSQLVYDGGSSTSKIAKSTLKAARASLERLEAANASALLAANSWNRLWESSERLKWLNNKTRIVEEIVTKIDWMASGGFSDKSTVQLAEREIINLALKNSRLEGELTSNQLVFYQYFKSRPKNVPEPINLSFDKHLPETNWKSFTIVKKSTIDLLLAESTREVAKAAYSPIISFNSSLSSPRSGGNQPEGNLGLVLKYTFGDGGFKDSELEVAEARVNGLQSKLEQSKTNSRNQVRTDRARLETIERNLILLQGKISLLEAELETLRSQLTTGQATLSKLVTMEMEHFETVDQIIQLKSEKHSIYFNSLSQAGKLGELTGLKYK
ncbi:TolC family protein [Rhodobacteraceae bacterium nBUS_24]